MDKTFIKIKEHAIERGGECLSKSYDYAGQALFFHCSCGNEWSSVPAGMLRMKTWCPKCGAKRGGFAAKKYIRKQCSLEREQLPLF